MSYDIANRMFFSTVTGKFRFLEDSAEFVKLSIPLNHDNFDMVNAVRISDGANYWVDDEEIVIQLDAIGEEKYVRS